MFVLCLLCPNHGCAGLTVQFDLVNLKKIDVVQVGKVRLWRAGDKAAGALLVQTAAPQ